MSKILYNISAILTLRSLRNTLYTRIDIEVTEVMVNMQQLRVMNLWIDAHILYSKIHILRITTSYGNSSINSTISF